MALTMYDFLFVTKESNYVIATTRKKTKQRSIELMCGNTELLSVIEDIVGAGSGFDFVWDTKRKGWIFRLDGVEFGYTKFEHNEEASLNERVRMYNLEQNAPYF